MSEVDDLLAACVAAPDDDAPRLVWADAVGGERGELVVIQCRLAREELPPAEAGALLQRQDELLAAHGKAWTGFADERAVKRCLFHRGFVESIEVDIGEMRWPAVFDTAPLVGTLRTRGVHQTIDYTEDSAPGPAPLATLRRLFDDPALRRLRGLELDDARVVEITGDTEWHYHSTSVADQVLELIASTGKLAGLRALSICDEYTARGLYELIGSNVLPTVERLRLQSGETPREMAQELFAAMPRVRALDDYAALGLAAVADLVPPSVVELRGILRTDAWAALSASPVARGLERLGIAGDEIVPPAAAFGPFPQLRALDYHGLSDGNRRAGGPAERAAAAAFAQLALPALRELRITGYLAPTDALGIADAFGAQLARLELMEQDGLPVDELRAKVAGQLVVTRYRSVTNRLLHASVDTRGPWLCDEPIALRNY